MPVVDFSHALPILRSGVKMRRTAWKDIQFVRMVIPKAEPLVDEPAPVYAIMSADGRQLLSGKEFGDAVEAQLTLESYQDAHAEVWQAYHAYQQAAAATDKNKDELPKSPGAPAKVEDYYSSASVVARAPRGATRLSEPYFTAQLSSGTVAVWVPSTSDILANDWLIA